MRGVKFRRGLTLQRKESLGVVIDRFSFRRRKFLRSKCSLTSLRIRSSLGKSQAPSSGAAAIDGPFFLFATVYSLLYKPSAQLGRTYGQEKAARAVDRRGESL
jgi:hypothetical protein